MYMHLNSTDTKKECDNNNNKIKELKMKILALEAEAEYRKYLFLSFMKQLHSISSGICTFMHNNDIHIRYTSDHKILSIYHELNMTSYVSMIAVHRGVKHVHKFNKIMQM